MSERRNDAQSDEQLMAAYQQGDSKAFNELYDRTSDRLYGYLERRLQSRELIDDVFQGSWAKFHRTRGQYRSPLPVMPWLFTICRSVMIDHLRQMEKRQENLQEEMGLYSNGTPSILETIEGALDPSAFEGVAGMKVLSAAQREALSLRFEQDLSFEEIALRIRTTPANARQLISRALRRLKSFMEKKGGDR